MSGSIARCFVLPAACCLRLATAALFMLAARSLTRLRSYDYEYKRVYSYMDPLYDGSDDKAAEGGEVSDWESR